jgi:hypothetical protein
MSADPHGLGDNLLLTTQFSSNGTGDAQSVLLFNKHSYQVVAEGAAQGFINIQMSNTSDGPWTTLSSVEINSGTSTNVTPGVEAGFVYDDTWTAVRARISVTGYVGGSFTIYENHIY